LVYNERRISTYNANDGKLKLNICEGSILKLFNNGWYENSEQIDWIYGAIYFSRDGNYLITNKGIWDTQIEYKFINLREDDGPSTACCISRDGNFVATVGYHGEVQIWDLRSYTSTIKIPGKGLNSPEIFGIAFDANNNLITVNESGEIVEYKFSQCTSEQDKKKSAAPKSYTP
jgi:WD40 repeat protein